MWHLCGLLEALLLCQKSAWIVFLTLRVFFLLFVLSQLLSHQVQIKVVVETFGEEHREKLHKELEAKASPGIARPRTV